MENTAMDAVEWFKFNQIFFILYDSEFVLSSLLFFSNSMSFLLYCPDFSQFLVFAHEQKRGAAIEEITRCFNENRNYSILFDDM